MGRHTSVRDALDCVVLNTARAIIEAGGSGTVGEVASHLAAGMELGLVLGTRYPEGASRVLKEMQAAMAAGRPADDPDMAGHVESLLGAAAELAGAGPH